jgi:putative NADH-flavin reductase
MKLLVLGATGGTGLEVVRRAIHRGHSVTAFARSAERLKPFADRIQVRQGDLLNRDELQAVAQGHDAIVSAFGPRLPLSNGDADLLRRFASALTSAMAGAGVRRVVVESSAFLFKDALVPPAYLVGRLFFAQIVADATGMERILSGSGLDWTIVRPPRLTDHAHTGKYRVREGHLPVFGFSISRADVADCMIRTAEDRSRIGKIIGASN